MHLGCGARFGGYADTPFDDGYAMWHREGRDAGYDTMRSYGEGRYEREAGRSSPRRAAARLGQCFHCRPGLQRCFKS